MRWAVASASVSNRCHSGVTAVTPRRVPCPAPVIVSPGRLVATLRNPPFRPELDQALATNPLALSFERSKEPDPHPLSDNRTNRLERYRQKSRQNRQDAQRASRRGLNRATIAAKNPDGARPAASRRSGFGDVRFTRGKARPGGSFVVPDRALTICLSPSAWSDIKTLGENRPVGSALADRRRTMPMVRKSRTLHDRCNRSYSGLSRSSSSGLSTSTTASVVSLPVFMSIPISRHSETWPSALVIRTIRVTRSHISGSRAAI